MRIAFWIAAIVTLVYLGLAALLFIFQRSLIYFPQPKTLAGAGTEILLPVRDATLAITARPLAGPKALIYFGGNAEDVSVNLPFLAQLFPDRAIYLLHYRGYGNSTGKPSEKDLHEDALALFEMVRAQHTDIAVVGRSLGSGVAIRLASARTISRLVLITPYASIEALAARQFPYFPVPWLLQDKFESSQYAPAVRAPTLLLVAEHDEVIPRWSSDKLLASFATGVASQKIIAGTGHNNISANAEYLQALSAGIN